MKDNRIYRTKNHGTNKPATKEEFAAMMVSEYGYDQKTAEDCAGFAAGHGAFDDGTAGLRKAVATNRKIAGLPPQEASMTLSFAARQLLATLQRWGDWDDGCFYYSGKSASELQAPMQDLADMIEKENATRDSGEIK